MSLVEAIANVVVGFSVAVTTQLVVFPSFGLRVPVSDNMLIGAIFTVVSLVRSYTLRRTFEALRLRQARRAAAPKNDGSVT